MNYHELRRALLAMRAATGREQHAVALVLGSGLGGYAEGLAGAVEVPYADLPGMPVPRVEGHGAALYSAEVAGHPVLVFAGRAHYYEGEPLERVVFGVRLAVLDGCHTVVLTNAAGGVGDHLRPGDLVLIRDHLNLAGANPLRGPNEDRLGPRFPDLTNLYNQNLRALAQQVGEEVDVPLQEGVYAWMAGPSYETPAEIQMVTRLGGDLVGMSTVPEAIAVHHMGAWVLGISLVTNLAAGISPTPLSHDEVQATAEAARERFTRLIDALLPRLVG